jgi:hypothetical protein
MHLRRRGPIAGLTGRPSNPAAIETHLSAALWPELKRRSRPSEPVPRPPTTTGPAITRSFLIPFRTTRTRRLPDWICFFDRASAARGEPVSHSTFACAEERPLVRPQDSNPAELLRSPVLPGSADKREQPHHYFEGRMDNISASLRSPWQRVCPNHENRSCQDQLSSPDGWVLA